MVCAVMRAVLVLMQSKAREVLKVHHFGSKYEFAVPSSLSLDVLERAWLLQDVHCHLGQRTTASVGGHDLRLPSDGLVIRVGMQRPCRHDHGYMLATRG